MSADKLYEKLNKYGKEFNSTFLEILRKVKDESKNKELDEFESDLIKLQRHNILFLLQKFYKIFYENSKSIEDKDEKFFLDPPFGNVNGLESKHKEVIETLTETTKNEYPNLSAVSKKYLWKKVANLLKLSIKYMLLTEKFAK